MLTAIVTTNAQKKGCSDSVVFNKFEPGIYFNYGENDFKNARIRDTADNIFVDEGSKYRGITSVIKFNGNNKTVWAKWYRPATNTSPMRSIGALAGIDENANLYFGNPYFLTPGLPGSIFTKTDSMGTIIWSKQFLTAGFVSTGVYDFISPEAGSNIFFNIGSGTFACNTAGNLLWAKKYAFLTLPANFYFSNAPAISCVLPGGNLLVCFAGYTSPSGTPGDPNSVYYAHFVKINGNTGNVIQQQTVRFFTGPGFSTKVIIYPSKIHCDFATGNILFVGIQGDLLGVSSGISKQVYYKMDINLNPVTAACINSTAIFYEYCSGSIPYISLGKKNEAVFIAHEFPNGTTPVSKLNYITVNNNLQITAQRKIDYTQFGFLQSCMKTTIGFKKDGTLNFQSGGYYNSNINVLSPLLVYDHIPFYNNLSPCLGYDTTLFTSSPALAQIINPAFNYQDTANLQVTVNNIVPDGSMQNFAVPETQICRQVSICDTIKIIGNGFHCISNPLDSFKLIRNPLCKRVTKWLVDTSAIKILSSTDTTLNVQYLKPYNGLIKVNFAGCTLADSLPVTVYSIPVGGLNLGNDIQVCAGTPVTLHAGIGFKTYKWQDGSTNENFTTTQAGKYYVTTTDSCGLMYADTLLIYSPPAIAPNLGNDTMHCPGKTIIFHAGLQYKLFIWQDSSRNESFSVTQPGKYYVTVTDSCNRLLSDTVIVKPNDLPLAVNYPYELCSWDTAKASLSTLITNYTWQPFNKATLSLNNQLLLYPGITTIYSLNGERPVGCILNDTVMIKVKQCPDYIFFPNAFTPNGDGLNDMYKPFIGGRIIAYNLTIFNRYGQVVFKSNNPVKGWNGIIGSSSKPIPGSYVWVCNYKFYNSEIVEKKGMLTLIR